MVLFKINISNKGKTLKIETESEALVRSKIGDKVQGSTASPDLEGYELEITGTSDSSGFPGLKGQVGQPLRKILLRKGDKGLRDRRKGIRLKKSVRGEEIGEKTTQINMIVIKEGAKKFIDLLPKKEAEPKEGESPAESPNQDAPDQEPKQTEPKEADPDQEPKITEKDKKELAQPDEEPKSN